MDWNTIGDAILPYLRAFLVGGILCVIAQILIDKTKLTPARILVTYVVAGVVLGAVGLYAPLVELGGAGATVPLTGFGYLISKGVQEAVEEKGLLGALTGPLTAAAGGTAAALVFGIILHLGQGHMQLIRQMQKKYDLTTIYITHDLGVVAGMAQKIVVMYAGTVVEMGTTDEIFYHGLHPYTNGLKDASPRLDGKGKRLHTIEGMPPELIDPPAGCPFAPRCTYATDRCWEKMPEMRQVSPTHFVRCEYRMAEEGGKA